MRLTGEALIFCCCLVAPVFAHHGGGVEYFMDQTRGPVTGTVTAFAFTFPHPHIEFDVKTANGAIEKWAAVFQPTPTNLRAAGWTRNGLESRPSQGRWRTLTRDAAASGRHWGASEPSRRGQSKRDETSAW